MKRHDGAQKPKTNLKCTYMPIVPDSWQGKVIISGSLLLFFIVTVYKLTNASLWFDEGVEYLVSVMPFKKMIPAINQTFQPPLYNFLMHFLLKISVSEYWFRFTSVLFGLLGCVGFYLSVNQACGWKVAGASIFFFTFLKNSVYYNQECAEYALVVCVLFWAIYFYICLLNQFSYLKAFGFTFFCILSIYAHYGAIFPLIGLSLSLLVFYCMDKRWSDSKRLVILMGGAVIAFGIPLYFCFTRFQREAQYTQYTPVAKPFVNLFDEFQQFIKGLQINLSILFTSFYRIQFFKILVNLFYICAICVIIWSIVQRANRILKYIGISAVITYLMYYLGVRFAIYAYGSNGGRYVNPIFPIILFGLCVSASSFLQLAQAYIKEKKGKKLSHVSVALIIMLLAVHNYTNWLAIQKNWDKREDVRSTLNLWLNETGGTDDIYIYYAAVPVFSFYAQNLNLDYGKEAVDVWGCFGTEIDPATTQYKNFHYGEWTREKDTAYVSNSIQKSFPNGLPDSLWFMLSHIINDNQTYMEAFSKLGYGYEIYRWEDARLLRLYTAAYLAANFSEVTDSKRDFSEYISGVNQITQTLNEDKSILLRLEGNDPQIFVTFPQNLNYDSTKAHKVLIEFKTEYAGEMQLFYQDKDHSDFIAENVVHSQYVVGDNRVFLELPKDSKLENLRLDMSNLQVQENQENNIILFKMIIYEEM